MCRQVSLRQKTAPLPSVRFAPDQSLDISPVANSSSGDFGPKHVRAAEYWCGLSAKVNQDFARPGRSKVEPRNRCRDVNANGLHADLEEYFRLGKIAWKDVPHRCTELSQGKK